MKTLTEFNGFSLKSALTTKQDLVKGGKTAEELPAALGEALKVEGDRLTYLLAALEVVDTKVDGLKRVLVFNAEEGQKAPSGTVQKGEKYYLAEYFYVPAPKGRERQDRDAKGGRDGGRGGKGGKRGGKGGGRDSERRGGRGPGAPGPGTPGADQNAGGGGGERRPPREGRPAARPQRPANAGPPQVKPNVTANTAAAKPTAATSDSTDGANTP